LPSLESRATDIPALTRHFLHAESGDPRRELTPEVEAYLVRRHYPGNVRDLKQLLARICCRHLGPGPVTVGDIPLEERPAGDGSPWWDAVGLASAVERAVAARIPLRDLNPRTGSAPRIGRTTIGCPESAIWAAAALCRLVKYPG